MNEQTDLVEQEEPITPVCFRMFVGAHSIKSGDVQDDVIAIFPAEREYQAGHCGSYVHMGQHGACSPLGLIGGFNTPDGKHHRVTRWARPEEYAALKAELERLGYRLKVYKRIPHSLYWWTAERSR